MELLLVRHAIAVERNSKGYIDDRARPLTPEGRKRMAESAAGIAKHFTPAEILTSPVLRARQTAEILAKAWRCPVAELESLGNGNHSTALSAVTQRAANRVAVVGHEPWMGELLSYALTGDANSVHAPFKKGAAALVESFGGEGPAEWSLTWAMPPAALRRIR